MVRAWWTPAYLLTTAGFQLVFGKLYTFFSIKWVYTAAIAIFELGSLVCGVAPNSTALIVGRAIAGLGSAGIFSGAYLIIAMSQPLEKRPMFQGLFGAMYGVASIVGPLMGESCDRSSFELFLSFSFSFLFAVWPVFPSRYQPPSWRKERDSHFDGVLACMTRVQDRNFHLSRTKSIDHMIL